MEALLAQISTSSECGQGSRSRNVEAPSGFGSQARTGRFLHSGGEGATASWAGLGVGSFCGGWGEGVRMAATMAEEGDPCAGRESLSLVLAL